MSEIATRSILRGGLIALLATAAGFAVEVVRLSDAESAEGVIVAFRPLLRPCRTCDRFEMVIEYTTPAGPRRFSKSRAVWDVPGEMGRTGTRLPILYTTDGRAWVDRFFYTHPFTGVMLIFDGLLIAAWLWLTTVGRQRFTKLTRQRAEYRRAALHPRGEIAPARRRLLREVSAMVLAMGAGIVATGAGFALGTITLAGSGLALVLGVRIFFWPRFTCPDCSGSLVGELRDLGLPLGGTTNWLMVRDALAKGVPLRCSNCKWDLDSYQPQ